MQEAQDRDDYRYFLNRVKYGGELLTGADLALAVTWCERNHGSVWAERYGGDFSATVGLIERSQKQHQFQVEAEARERQRAELEADGLGSCIVRSYCKLRSES